MELAGRKRFDKEATLENLSDASSLVSSISNTWLFAIDLGCLPSTRWKGTLALIASCGGIGEPTFSCFAAVCTPPIQSSAAERSFAAATTGLEASFQFLESFAEPSLWVMVPLGSLSGVLSFSLERKEND